MDRKLQFDITYMRMALDFSNLSHAVRKKVGALVVTPENVVLCSYNGTPSGWDNACEYEEMELAPQLFGEPSKGFIKTGNLITHDHVIHAELNSILHAARQGVSVKGATMYITLSPCARCAAMIAQAGIKRVVYFEKYRDSAGISLLTAHNIEVTQLEKIYS